MLAYEEKHIEKVVEMLLVGYYDVVYKKPHHIDFFIENKNESETLDILKNLPILRT